MSILYGRRLFLLSCLGGKPKGVSMFLKEKEVALFLVVGEGKYRSIRVMAQIANVSYVFAWRLVKEWIRRGWVIVQNEPRKVFVLSDEGQKLKQHLLSIREWEKEQENGA